MAFQFITPIGVGSVTDVLSTKAFLVGTVAKAVDPILGEAEFIFLPGVASTVAGHVVIYDTYAGTTKLAVAGDRGPAAVAMAATVASTYGWYQIRGVATIKETSAVAAGKPYLTATPGVPAVAVVTGDKLDGATFKTADATPAAGFAYAQITYPVLNGLG